MKKFAGVLCVLIAIGGAGFFFGWAQLAVPPGMVGVLRSKTHGVDPRVIREGECYWAWYKLIPTNARTDLFTLRRVSRAFSVAGSLPSGAAYTALAGVNAAFDWAAAGDLAFTIRAEALPGLARREAVADQEGLEALEEEYARRLEAYVLERLGYYGADPGRLPGDAGEPPAGEPAATALARALTGDIEGAFPEIENPRVTLRTARLPDYGLYRSVKGLYDDYMARQHAVLRDDILREAEERMESSLRLDELSRYGEVLTKYPILMQYLELEARGGR